MNEEQTTQETPAQESTAQGEQAAAPDTPETPARSTPVPEEAASQGDFFDLMGDEGKKYKKEEKKPPPKGAGQTASQKSTAAKPAPKK